MQRVTHQSRTGLHLFLMMAATALAFVPTDGFAQYGKEAFGSAAALTEKDIAAMQKAAREDLTGKPKGTTLPWSNPESEKQGTVTLVDSFASKGRDCRRVRYVIRPGPKDLHPAPSTYMLTNCRLTNGTWQLDPDAKPDKSG